MIGISRCLDEYGAKLLAYYFGALSGNLRHVYSVRRMTFFMMHHCCAIDFPNLLAGMFS
jgi:hypothetical protein